MYDALNKVETCFSGCFSVPSRLRNQVRKNLQTLILTDFLFGNANFHFCFSTYEKDTHIHLPLSKSPLITNNNV